MDEVIYYKGRIYLVPNSQLRERVLQAAYDSPLFEHQGFRKTYMVVQKRFTWKGLKENVLQHVRECEACQRNKGELTHPTGLLQPLPIPKGKWESISMDFITRLPTVQGKDCIHIVVDRLTNFAHFFAIPTRYTAANVVKFFFQEIFRLHGSPRT